MSLKFNPLLRGGFDESKRILNDLEDVNTAGTADGLVLAWEQSSGTWKPAVAGVGDMLKSDYVTGQGTVYNASRLEGETLGSVRAHGVDAGTITQGTIGLARVPTMDDAHIPNLETLSGAAFGTAQMPSLGAYKIASGTLNADRIPALPTTRVTTGTFDDARIPDTGVVAVNYVIDGGGDTIGTGIKGDLEVPFACHVNRWTMLADQHGSIVVDVWRDSYANFPPTDADSMSGTTNMTAISGTVAAQGNLSGWGTQGIASGDILRYNVDSCTSIKRCTLALKTIKK